jgi:aminoglycoside phosphotransferase (APT) family kinase protein
MITSLQQDREPLEQRAAEITRPEFIEGTVYPLATGRHGWGRPAPACETAVVRNTGTGRLTVSYRFEDGTTLYGKLYSDDLGLHSFRVLRELWDGGFRAGAPHQVPEPLAFLADHNFVLARAAPGEPLLCVLGQEHPDLLVRVRAAARWLVDLHRSSLRLGAAESLWESLKLFRVVRRLTKAVARAPQLRTLLTDLVEALCETGKRSPADAPAVQTHGRFHYEHIFAEGPTVTLIDLDRSVPSDPAKDLAEFVSMFRLKTFKLSGSVAAAEGPTRAFLEEYLAHLPGNAGNLAVHWGAFLLLNMFNYVKRPIPDAAARERMMRFYRGELEYALSGRWVSA